MKQRGCVLLEGLVVREGLPVYKSPSTVKYIRHQRRRYPSDGRSVKKIH